MYRFPCLLGSAFAAIMVLVPCTAQNAFGPQGNIPAAPATGTDTVINQIERSDNYDLLRKNRAKTNAGKKSLDELLAEDKAAATELAAAMKLPCVVVDAILLTEGSEPAGGQTVKTHSYEVACGNGMGYFLTGRDQPGVSSAFTCFAADAALAADVAARRQPGPVCSLGNNAGIKAMAEKILTGTGKSCTVGDTRWIGQSEKSKTDYLEVACEGGSGFVIASPLPGSTLPVMAVNCRDATMQGIPCKLSDNGKVVTMQTFKDALAAHGVACDASEMRPVGKESMKKRHVVEFSCPAQQPNGLVAFIPSEDATAPFEVLDCAGAAKRGIVCTYKPTK